MVISNSSCSFLIYFSAVSFSFLNRAVTWEIWSISNGTTWREGQRIGLEINVTMYKKYKHNRNYSFKSRLKINLTLCTLDQGLKQISKIVFNVTHTTKILGIQYHPERGRWRRLAIRFQYHQISVKYQKRGKRFSLIHTRWIKYNAIEYDNWAELNLHDTSSKL